MRKGWTSRLRSVSTRALAFGVAAGLVVNGFAPVAFAEDAAPAAPPAAAAAPADKSAQEIVFWQSVEKSNTLADYQAYLAAFPNGIFAPLAKNRVAALSAPAAAPANPDAQNSAPAPAEANPQQAAAPAVNAPPGPAVAAAPEPPLLPPSAFGPPPVPPSPEALKAEVGTVDTEAQLEMGPPARRELQMRLRALGLYGGPIDGDLGPGARAGIAEWQKRRDLAPTGELGPLEIDQLRIDSEPQYDIVLLSPPPPRVIYAPVRHVVVERAVAAPVALGIIGAVAAGFLGAKLGGGFGHGGKHGGGHAGGKKKIRR